VTLVQKLGTIFFWNGSTTGSSTGFSFGTTMEPNQLGNEDYTHITAPGLGSQVPGMIYQSFGDPDPK
jgi:hypothetical protein